MAFRISALPFPAALVIGPALRAQPVFRDSQAPQVSFASPKVLAPLDRESRICPEPIVSRVSTWDPMATTGAANSSIRSRKTRGSL